MIQRRDLRGSDPGSTTQHALIPRARIDVSTVLPVAHDLIEAVRAQGSTALVKQSERFDGVRPPRIRVSTAEITTATAALEGSVRSALEEAIDRIRHGTLAQIPPEITTDIAPGAQIVQRWAPVARAGLYVPGGKAVYPSSVVMNVVAAQVAGVQSITIASPPQREFAGSVHPTILAAAGLLGIEEIYAMGGAGAIGALAWGVPDIGLEPVQVVSGPGNVFVAAAKRLVRGQVGIDSEAGTTEVLIIADHEADPRLVAADLVSQAEHDEAAAAVLVTPSRELADAVAHELDAQSSSTKHSERVRAALAGQQSAIVLVDNLTRAAEFSNAYGPEHLEIQTKNPEAVLTHIHNAGAIFLGPDSPVSLGDYLAGSNHVLPTGGQARFASGLGAYTFLRAQQIIRYDRAALGEVADKIQVLAAAEDLPAHDEAIAVRFDAAWATP